jgi:hypothetical protein
MNKSLPLTILALLLLSGYSCEQLDSDSQDAPPILANDHPLSKILAGPVSMYQSGTFFLPPDVSSYNDPFTYFLGITYSVDHNQFQLTNGGCDNTLKLVPTLKELYKDAGAHRFHTNRAGYGANLLIGPGFYTIPLATIPLNGTLHLYLTSQSAVNPGTDDTINLMVCLMTETPITCFTQSPANKLMLDDMNANTNVELPEWSCLDGGELAGIILGSIGGAVLFCLLLCFIWKKCKHYYKYKNINDGTI